MDDPIPTGHRIGDEPHLGRRSFRRDSTEELAAEVLADESLHGDPTGHLAEQSVHEEAHTLHATRATEGGWALWLDRKRAEVGALDSWCVVLFFALVSGPLAVVESLFTWSAHPLALLVLGPATEEVLKVALLAVLVETRPYLLRSALQIRVVALSSALAFALVENLLYLNVHIDDPSPELVLWRWSACTGLHLFATALAVEGLVGSWRRSMERRPRPTLDGAYGWLGAAIAVHGLYNLAVFLLERSGFAS